MKLKLIKSLLLTGLLSMVASVSVFAADAPKIIDVKQVSSLQKSGSLLIDVREVDEYAEAHVAGSTLIPLGQLQQRLQELGTDKSKPIVLICRSGRRSEKAQSILEQAGFSATSNVEGGMIAWQKAALPVVTGSASR